jgi:hypothetical protein
MTSSRGTIAATATALLAPLLVVPLASSAASAGEGSTPGPLASSIAVSWQRTAIRTIYTEGSKAPPEGALYLAFTSLAVHEAAVEAQRHGTAAAAAAVAAAAHGVLRQYFPASGAALDADLAASLAIVQDGKKQAAGMAIGASAADEMIASRVGDGRNDASHVYSKAPAPGVWQPAPGGGMALPWLGFVTPVVDVEPVALDGPDPLTSAAYAQDYEEVRLVGGTDSAARGADQTAIAQFFAGNPIPMYRTALCNLLAAEPLGLLPTTRLFARIDAAMANTFIQTWRLKYDIGFWRPYAAIAGALTDDNPSTNPHPVPWVPLITNPAYSDYTTGHGSATSPFAQVLRRTLGDDTHLVLTFGGMSRHYDTLTALEHDALHARIWGGLHFRDAMEDGYYMGHTTADRVIQAIR